MYIIRRGFSPREQEKLEKARLAYLDQIPHKKRLTADAAGFSVRVARVLLFFLALQKTEILDNLSRGKQVRRTVNLHLPEMASTLL
jgi:hypothetical protein